MVIKKKSIPPSAKVERVSVSEVRGEPPKRDLSGSKAVERLVHAVTPLAVPPKPNYQQTLSFRIVKPSLESLEKAMSVALFFEQYYHDLLRPPKSRETAAADPHNYGLARRGRMVALEAYFALAENRFMSEDEKDARRDALLREENRILRERRKKVDVRAFELGRVIGHGAFGVVRIARERESGRLVAMKQVSRDLHAQSPAEAALTF